jgi:hypothetical protein
MMQTITRIIRMMIAALPEMGMPKSLPWNPALTGLFRRDARRPVSKAAERRTGCP